MTIIDWERLRIEAAKAAKNSYSPYSKFKVGAAGLTENGELVSGCNVENVSYGLTMCAESSLVANLFQLGPNERLVAVAVVSGTGEPCVPCGRCRQLLHEHGGDRCLIDDGEPRPLSELLPNAFDSSRLSNG